MSKYPELRGPSGHLRAGRRNGAAGVKAMGEVMAQGSE